MNEWPLRMQCGRITITTHAPWCPTELARQALAGSTGDSSAVSFADGLEPECRCAVAPPMPRGAPPAEVQ